MSTSTTRPARQSVPPAVALARDVRRMAGLPASLVDHKVLARVRAIVDPPHRYQRQGVDQPETEAS